MAMLPPLPSRVLKPSPRATEALAGAVEELQVSEHRVRDWYGRYVDSHHERLAIDFDLVCAIDPERARRVLDVGSSPPLLGLALCADGREVTGVDIAPDRFAANGLEIRRCNVETESLPFPDGAFGMVIFNELFEHLRINPIHTFREVSRVLQPGGVLSLSTPNARSLLGIRNLLLHQRTGWCNQGIFAEYSKLELLGHMGHVREYTLPELRDFLGHFDLNVRGVVWRGAVPGQYELAAKVVPSLSPFMSLVAVRD